MHFPINVFLLAALARTVRAGCNLEVLDILGDHPATGLRTRWTLSCSAAEPEPILMSLTSWIQDGDVEVGQRVNTWGWGPNKGHYPRLIVDLPAGMVPSLPAKLAWCAEWAVKLSENPAVPDVYGKACVTDKTVLAALGGKVSCTGCFRGDTAFFMQYYDREHPRPM
ncbi:MAG: hypothetical protein M1816_001921 [Peltula sp. TS41687]|nr:MAG: hypothetical protein M1816_001921 [Peltula sp. TS41687]